MMWAAIVLAGLASYLLRVLPLLLLGRVDLPERATAALQHAAMGAMVVMLVTGAAQAAGAGAPPAAGDGTDAGDTVPLAGRGVAVAAAVAAGLVLARRGRSMPVVVLASLSVWAAAGWAATVVGARLG